MHDLLKYVIPEHLTLISPMKIGIYADDMTPQWYPKTYYRNGNVSSDWNNLNNWKVNGSIPNYFYDAGNYLIIQSSANPPEISNSGTTYCTKIKIDMNAVLSISSGMLKVGP